MLDPSPSTLTYRPYGKGGGVCAIVHKRIAVVPLDIPSKYDELEVIGFDVVDVTPVKRHNCYTFMHNRTYTTTFTIGAVGQR